MWRKTKDETETILKATIQTITKASNQWTSICSNNKRRLFIDDEWCRVGSGRGMKGKQRIKRISSIRHFAHVVIAISTKAHNFTFNTADFRLMGNELQNSNTPNMLWHSPMAIGDLLWTVWSSFGSIRVIFCHWSDAQHLHNGISYEFRLVGDKTVRNLL